MQLRKGVFWAGLLWSAAAIGASGAPEGISQLHKETTALMHPYPESHAEPLRDDYFGVMVDDPYRWLEADVRTSPAVADWVKRQNVFTQTYLSQLKQRAVIARAISTKYQRIRYGIPVSRGKSYFYTRQTESENQPVLVVRRGNKGKETVLVDPHGWGANSHSALDVWEPSPDGRYIAFMRQVDGSDWRTIHIVDTQTGHELPDRIDWVKFSGLSWVDSRSFVYSRFPTVGKGSTFHALNLGQAVFLHRINTDQGFDEPLYATPEEAALNHTAQATSDGRWVVISSSSGTDERNSVHLIRPGAKQVEARALIDGFTDEWRLVDGVGDRLWFVTSHDAPMLQLMEVDVGKREPKFRTVVAERAQPLASASLIGARFILTYLKDAQSLAELVALDGAPVAKIDLNWIGAAQGFHGGANSSETFYRFSSFTRPGQIYRMDTQTGKTSLFASGEMDFDPRDYITEQRFYPSKDGTQIPMFLVYRRDLDLSKGAPTLLYGYGGFNVSLTPSFSEAHMAWLEAGGVYAMANLRGGGEYGRAWHDAGRLLRKQNVFDDFISAAEYLIQQKITSSHQLAIEGRSNGGLLIGAVMNQRPELFAAGHAAVGVMDMLRFDRFTAGRYWTDDYGNPAVKADFRNLRAYSPYHNIRPESRYPALIVTTADTDDRVVPGHSFKYIARMQNQGGGSAPHLIRIEANAGHGSGMPVDKKIAEEADIVAFLAARTGLEFKPTSAGRLPD